MPRRTGAPRGMKMGSARFQRAVRGILPHNQSGKMLDCTPKMGVLPKLRIFGRQYAWKGVMGKKRW